MSYYNRFIIERKLKGFIEEDCNFGDISSISISSNTETTAKIFARSTGYVSGLEELKIIFEMLDVSTDLNKNDGDAFQKEDVIAILKGNAKNILLGERVCLNLLTHMSAITSTTRKFVELIKNSGKKVKIACTRKTTPGLRLFEKKAVEFGHGDSHRFSLDDMVLLKDTHLRYYKGDIEKLLADIRKKVSFSKKIEIEVEKVEDVLIAANNGADIIMLDNFSPDGVVDCINLLKKHNLRNKVIIEVSGGINLENIVDYLISEPDVISSGQLTQFPSEKVDFSLRFD
ncbi:MAG: carboxylating nicotinate-nucleotide diphosphorylase [Candidatus Lokiarchaeota archaeon]|nr:carboxylating nicotinate-nucleotide diphosphorylase [Candidatus Lokiarchaeota archaeon]